MQEAHVINQAGNLSRRLFEAAKWLVDDIPSNTALLSHLEGDVTLDQLDLYCVELMREAAQVLAAIDKAAESPLSLDIPNKEAC